MSKPGRNDPCPCGSGRKYKKCCLARDEASRPRLPAPRGAEDFITEVRPDLDEAVDRLLQRVELGAGRGIESEIQALWQQHPDYHTANYAMGVFRATVLEDSAGAIPFFEKAVNIFPPFPEAYFNLALAARNVFDIPKAIAAYRATIRYSDDDLGEMAQKELDGFEKAIAKASPFRTLDAYLANSQLFDQAFECLANRKFEQSVALFKQVLAEHPSHVQSYGNLGLAYAGLGRRSDALACFDRALALDPTYEPALLNQRNVTELREGEPMNLDQVLEVEYYSDRFRESKRQNKSDG